MKKDIEWLKDRILASQETYVAERDSFEPHSGGRRHYNGTLSSISLILGLINQLDEPEVLSQEENINIVLNDLKEYIKEQQSLSQNVGLAHTSAGNDTHYRQYDYVLECIDEYEPSDELQNLIVPKNELPVIPKYVADFIEEIKKNDKTLVFAISYIYDENEGINQPDEEINKIYCWIESYDNEETFARAWLDGYKVEEEQKYYVMNEENELILGWSQSAYMSPCIEGYEYMKHNGRENLFQLTEQEIKDYDERYWAFAEPVEELV